MEAKKMTYDLKQVVIKIPDNANSGEVELENGKKIVWKLIETEATMQEDTPAARRVEGLMKIRKAIASPFLEKNFKPLTRDEIYEGR
jgi:hypothetical protein